MKKKQLNSNFYKSLDFWGGVLMASVALPLLTGGGFQGFYGWYQVIVGIAGLFFIVVSLFKRE
ncbi:hypothetical protein [uncultured Secundilactobacillus sp.]|uniref:hypothetical protein n=1 Tax=uncultured Secundilactobacillus sp. TaxID=2813935 RepID=UPI00258BDF7F|nr:hypothetical protein [uncultured Secundilactobacillus sp.]